mmetsp:Transcript_2821/g.4552  ORF Transcript_2821/g.4552 Transcript_2821/m.4552 type:complete len:207 (-) Transcript_2821:404-1024(-)
MPLPLMRSRGCTVVLVKVLSRLLLHWVSDAMTEFSFNLQAYRPDDTFSLLDSSLHVEDEKREVNRFLGWAIFNLRRKLARRRVTASDSSWVLTEDVDAMISLLDSMRIFHNKAIVYVEYMRECYSAADQSRNGGWLSLVSKQYFPFGKILLNEIRFSVNSQWTRRGNKTVEVAVEKIMNSNVVSAFFWGGACQQDSHFSNDVKLSA